MKKLQLLVATLALILTALAVPPPLTSTIDPVAPPWTPTASQTAFINGEIVFDLEIYESLPDDVKVLVPIAIMPTELLERDRKWVLPESYWINRTSLHRAEFGTNVSVVLFKTIRPTPPGVTNLIGYVPGGAYKTHWTSQYTNYSLITQPVAGLVAKAKPKKVEFVIEFYDDLTTNPVAKVTRTMDGDMGFVGTKTIITE